MFIKMWETSKLKSWEWGVRLPKTSVEQDKHQGQTAPSR